MNTITKYFILADNQVWTHGDGYLVKYSSQALIRLFDLCKDVEVKHNDEVVGKIISAKIANSLNNVTTLTVGITFFKKPIQVKRDLGVRWHENEYHWDRYGENDLCVVDNIATIYSIEVFGIFSDKSNSVKVKPKRVKNHR